jgi:uncharacterized protein involved in exopolysaccharide biosynthesis
MSGDAMMDLGELFAVVRRRYRFVLATGLGAAVLTLAITFVLPKWYKATSVILPPDESDLLSNMSLAQRALTKFPAFGILSDYFTPADIYKAILGSRTVGDTIVARFDLQHVYRIKSREKTLKELTNHTSVKLNPDGTIAVSVEDRSPKRAAAMTNAYITELDRFNVEKRSTSARRTREFLQQRVSETDSLLRASEATLRDYQEERHTIAPVGAGTEAMQAAADLMSRKMMLEVRLGMLRDYLRDENEQVVQVRSELDQLDRRIAQLPALENDLQRLVRDSKMYEQLYLLLTSELERSRVRETMDTPTVQVLDAAVPPERHSWPHKGLLTAIAGAVGLVLSSAWVILRERPTPDAAG